MRVDFDQLPPGSRLWIFAAERPLGAEERRALLDTVDAFLDAWKAHGAPLSAGRALRGDQFLLVAVDESSAGASGCSIDAMVRVLSDLERELSVELVNHAPVLFRTAGGHVARVSRNEFADLVRRGVVTPQTVVFNNTLTRLDELNAGRWETAARDSWHARAFFSGVTESPAR